MAERVIGPYFFENEKGQPERINGALYRTMLENAQRPKIIRRYGSNRMELLPGRRWTSCKKFSVNE
jgi:hypothetical protein